jgi:hypothetical protein
LGDCVAIVAMRTFFVLVFWIGVVLLTVSAVGSRVAWIRHRRRAEPVRAAEALLGTVLSLLCLGVLWFVYQWLF